ncbi:MAG: transcriptional regulator [Thermomicrobiales bacterium]
MTRTSIPPIPTAATSTNSASEVLPDVPADVQEAERVEQRKQEVALRALPETRRAMLEVLKREGSADADRLAEQTTITTSGARQHLVALEAAGLVTHAVVREGPGRPRHVYALTPAGDALFPRVYSALTNELLGYIADEDPALVERLFARRGERRLAAALERTAGLAVAEKVRVLAQILDEDGYLADFTEAEDGSFLITEHNCAVLSVAQRYGHACSSELEFLQRTLPEAEVTRIAHRLNGAHVCAYRVVVTPTRS